MTALLRQVTIFIPLMDSLRGSSVKVGTIQRRLAWPLRKDDPHELCSYPPWNRSTLRWSQPADPASHNNRNNNNNNNNNDNNNNAKYSNNNSSNSNSIASAPTEQKKCEIASPAGELSDRTPDLQAHAIIYSIIYIYIVYIYI